MLGAEQAKVGGTVAVGDLVAAGVQSEGQDSVDEAGWGARSSPHLMRDWRAGPWGSPSVSPQLLLKARLWGREGAGVVRQVGGGGLLLRKCFL